MALGAIASGVTAGIGAWVAKGAGVIAKGLKALQESQKLAAKLLYASANGAMTSALMQGIAVATGVQSSFSWREVAISAVAAPVAAAVGGFAGGQLKSAVAGQFVGGVASSLVRRAFGGKVDTATAIADAFGNALGNSVVDHMNSRQTRRERWTNGGGGEVSADRSERALPVLSDPIFAEPVPNLNPSESGMLVVTTPDEARTVAAASSTAGSAGTASTPPVVSFDRTRGQWIATYADGTVLGHDGNAWSSSALISDTVIVTGTRYSAREARYYDEHIRWGGTGEMAGRIIERQRARDRAIANPASFSRDMQLAVQSGISMDQLLAARASALPRELRGVATMYDAPGAPVGFGERVWNGIGAAASSVVDAVNSPGDAIVGMAKTIPNAATGAIEFLAQGFAAQGAIETSNALGLSFAQTTQLINEVNAAVSSAFDPFMFDYSNTAQQGGALIFDAGSAIFGGAIAIRSIAGRSAASADRLLGARGPFSGRDFDPAAAGGAIRELSTDRIRITHSGIDVVQGHIGRFGADAANDVMVARLRQIADGTLEATQVDRNFYSHELREFVRYRRLGWRAGQPTDANQAYSLWNNAHTATLEDYRLSSRPSELYHPDAMLLIGQ